MKRGILEAALLLLLSALLGAGAAGLRRPPLPLRLPADFYRVESGARPLLLPQARLRHAQGGSGFLDLRSPDAFALGHVAGAVSLPADRIARDHDRVAEWIEGIPLVLYGRRGEVNRVDTAALLLQELGYGPLFILVDGFEAWEESGGAVETGAAPDEQGEGWEE